MRPTVRLPPGTVVSAEFGPSIIGESDEWEPDTVLHVAGLDVVIPPDVRDQLVDALIDPDPGP